MGPRAVAACFVIMVAAVERPQVMAEALLMVEVPLEVADPHGLIVTDLLLSVFLLDWEPWLLSFCYAAFTALGGSGGVQTLCCLHSHLWLNSIRMLQEDTALLLGIPARRMQI